MSTTVLLINTQSYLLHILIMLFVSAIIWSNEEGIELLTTQLKRKIK